jgi:hypothetical protein
MTPPAHAAAITAVIQLAIAPVFLLSAVGVLMAVLTTYLTRTVDRIRVLEEVVVSGSAEARAVASREIGVLGRRLRLVFLALILDVACALFVAVLIIVAFVAAYFGLQMTTVIALLFVAAMLSFVASLLVILRGIFLAITRVVGFVPAAPER